MTERPVIISGLDGATPLGFLAGLGLLKVLSEVSVNGDVPRLSWRFMERWHPVLHGPAGFAEIAEIVYEDSVRWGELPVLRFRYPKPEKKGVKLVGALRPPVSVLRFWLKDRFRAKDTLSLAYAAALTSEQAHEPVDSKKLLTHEHLVAGGVSFDADAPTNRATMATFFDFTSRNAQFLEQVDEVRKQVTLAGIQSVLQDGVPDPESSRTLDWDMTADAPGAIYELRERGYRPAAEWLAFRGLAFFPVAGHSGVAHTTACEGRRKAGAFTWALWDQPIDVEVVASLVAYRKLARLEPSNRRALGLVQVFRCALTKKADGYSGVFAPSEPV